MAAKKAMKIRPWTKEDIRTLKAMAREKIRASEIARELKRSYAATRQKASSLINQSISMFTSCSVFEGWLLIERTDFLGVVL